MCPLCTEGYQPVGGTARREGEGAYCIDGGVKSRCPVSMTVGNKAPISCHMSMNLKEFAGESG